VFFQTWYLQIYEFLTTIASSSFDLLLFPEKHRILTSFFPYLSLMAKPGRNNTKTISERTILAWATALLDTENSTMSTVDSLAEWICLSQLLPQLPADSTTSLWQRLMSDDTASPPYFSALIRGGLLSYLPWSERIQIPQREFAQQLVDRHKKLAQRLDPDETGLLPGAELINDSQQYPAVQAAWIWSADKLLELADTDLGDLPQLKEIYIHETDLQLWDKSRGCYGIGASVPPLTANLLTSNALILFAGIADQERAEKVLRWLRTHGSPWQDPDVLATEWLEASAYLLFVALEQYEMTDEAQKLKKYAQKHLASLPEDAASECLRWLWYQA
jgi:hypothetical protein